MLGVDVVVAAEPAPLLGANQRCSRATHLGFVPAVASIVQLQRLVIRAAPEREGAAAGGTSTVKTPSAKKRPSA